MTQKSSEPKKPSFDTLDFDTKKKKGLFLFFNWKITTLITTVAIVAGTIPIYFFVTYRKPEPTLIAVENKPQMVTALGRLQPKEKVIHLSASSSFEQAKVQEILVEEGDWVKVGQVIAILDSYDRLKAELQESKQQVAVAEARLNQVKAGAKFGEIEAQKATIARLESDLRQENIVQQANVSRLELQLVRERVAQEAKIERLTAEFQNAQTECDRHEILFQEGVVSLSTRDDECLIATTTQKQIKEAQAIERQTIETLREEIVEAKAAQTQIRKSLRKQIEEAQATLHEIKQVRPEDVQVAQAELQQALATVEKQQAELDLASVRTFKEGRILKIHTYPGELVSSNGIVELGQTGQMYAIAEVYETDIGKVKPGQKATIIAQFSNLNDTLRGTVEDVGWKIGKRDVLDTDPASDVDVRVQEVKIRIDPQDNAKVTRFTNLQVQVNIHL
ncbi:MAG: ABC exporter membrane fusion protein [Crocosphaera sp.]|uniref:ABC exporter membrane fusion protein n=1 Tax=Crocosphaera sp. TaxID=2729996 RepID=UPI00258A49FC|nr:ABC exporter membrane fusion protein [Crocosphaera sp.]MCH2245132.1 ABC exporter membrane fusion protein [Crocosphaera sp.]